MEIGNHFNICFIDSNMSPILGDVSAVVRVVPSKQVIFLLCSLSFQLIFYCPEQCAAAEVVDKNGNYSNSEGPTEQVRIENISASLIL